jgi:hypothetical protein
MFFKRGNAIFCFSDRTYRCNKTNLMHYLFSIYFVSDLYMFWACYCPSSGGVIVYLYIQQLVRVMFLIWMSAGRVDPASRPPN